MAGCPREVQRAQRGQRTLLRALNGAVLGALAAGAFGGLLGAFVILLIPMAPSPSWIALWGAVLGGLPGAVGGFWIGMTVVIRNEASRLRAGVAVGGLVGLVYALLLCGTYGGSIAVFAAPQSLVGGGLLGAGMSGVVRWTRSRWRWWTRWEE